MLDDSRSSPDASIPAHPDEGGPVDPLKNTFLIDIAKG